MTETTRRAMLTGAVAAGAAAALAACGDGDDGGAGTGTGTNGGGATGSGATGSGTTGQGGNQPPTGGLARTGDIPVGGGKIFADQDVVITQPAAGTFKGFSAACTHEGCTVTAVRNGVIRCGCHGSEFSITDGSVEQGPATSSLPAKALKVDGDSISLA